jgi:hypothetical protein
VITIGGALLVLLLVFATFGHVLPLWAVFAVAGAGVLYLLVAHKGERP